MNITDAEILEKNKRVLEIVERELKELADNSQEIEDAIINLHYAIFRYELHHGVWEKM